MTKRFENKIALVTGASRGIGRAACHWRWPRKAPMSSRWPALSAGWRSSTTKFSAGGTATLVPLDVKDFEALDRLGASIFERWGKLDAFLGNAGVLGVLTPSAHLDPRSFRKRWT